MKHVARAFAALLATTAILIPVPAQSTEDFRLVYFPHGDVASGFTNDWGDPRPGGRRHQGTDISADKHSEVVAVADGFVTQIGENQRSGFYVRIEHRDGWQSWYMHLNNDTPGTDDGDGGPEFAFAPGLEEGLFVSAGTVIGAKFGAGAADLRRSSRLSQRSPRNIHVARSDWSSSKSA